MPNITLYYVAKVKNLLNEPGEPSKVLEYRVRKFRTEQMAYVFIDRSSNQQHWERHGQQLIAFSFSGFGIKKLI